MLNYLKYNLGWRRGEESQGKEQPEFVQIIALCSLPNTMDAHHASLGRRTVLFSSYRFLHFFFFFLNLNNPPFLLCDYSFKSQLEEIRQKRAAERLIKASSGPDLTQPSFHNGSHHLSLSLIIKLSFFLKKKYFFFCAQILLE